MNTYSRSVVGLQKFLSAMALFALVFSPFASVQFANAQAPNDYPNDPDVTICHATNADSNPYGPGSQTVNASSIINGPNGHDDHSGPVWFSGITGGWGDIIPPFDYDFGEGRSGSYPGKNWTTEGELIWNDNCQTEQGTGSITIVKSGNGEGGDSTSFEFSVDIEDPNFFVDGDKSDSFTIEDLEADSYTITEVNIPEGWYFDKVSCSGPDSSDWDSEGDAGVSVDLGEGDDITCTFYNNYDSKPDLCMDDNASNFNQSLPCEYPESDNAKIIAHKIVCTDEADLPNWGAGGPDIDGSTAQDWVDSYDSCDFERGWEFQWGPEDSVDPGDTMVGEAAAPWTTFGPTDGSGMAMTEISARQIGDDSHLWFREVLQSDYIPFTHDQNGKTNVDDYTAEVYCHTDVKNYDNFDRIDGIDVEETYNCVAWNYTEVKSEDIEICKVDGNEDPVAGWTMGLSNDEPGNATRHTTEKDGCVTVSVDPEEGPWRVIEEDREGWEFEDIWVDGGFLIDDKETVGCEFFGDQKTRVSAVACGDDNKCLPPEPEGFSCTFMNVQEESVCEIGENLLENGSFEEEVVTTDKLWERFASVTGWVVESIADSVSAGLELHRGWKGNEAADGEQYAELDAHEDGARDSVRISQDVVTEEGATYELRWAFAPRHNIDAEQNQLSVIIDDIEVATEGPESGSAPLAQGDWTLSAYEFEAGSNLTEIAFEDAGEPQNDQLGTFFDDAVLCKIKEAPQCEPERHVWADEAVDSEQGLVKGGGTIPVNRSNPDEAIGESDWSPGDSDGFFSLGFGGWIEVSFEKFVVDVDGDDISIHEATNGTYPLETAKIEVSQDGSTWYALTEEARNDSNDGGAGITLLDFSETGLSWIKFVRITDTSDQEIHKNGTDGFDLDAVDATYVVCDEPKSKECTVTIVSDDTATVVEKDGAFAELLSFVHSAWTAVIPGAQWIWGDDPVADPANPETQTFENKFGWAGTVDSATLYVASDNDHSATINNGTAYAGGSSFGTAVSYDVSSEIAQGNNDLAVMVDNLAGSSNPRNNPAGVMYKLEVTTTDDVECNPPYEEDIPLYLVEGYVWDDQNENDCWDGEDECVFEQSFVEEEEQVEDREDPLPGWTVSITNGVLTYSTTTDPSGYYYFDVPAGTWTITETVQNEWEHTFPNDGTHVVTVPEVTAAQSESNNLFARIMNFIVPTAHAQYKVSFLSKTLYNFGNVFVGGSVVTSTGGGGGSSSSPRCDAFDLDGDTLSWETRRGFDLEITQNGSAIFTTTDDDEVDAGEFDLTESAIVGDEFELTVNRGSKDDTCTIELGGEGEVLGEATEIIPAGAPGTGAGGAASPTVSSLLSLLLAGLAIGTRKLKNV